LAPSESVHELRMSDYMPNRIAYGVLCVPGVKLATGQDCWPPSVSTTCECPLSPKWVVGANGVRWETFLVHGVWGSGCVDRGRCAR